MGPAGGTSSTRAVRRLGVVPALDGFRGIAVLMVIMSHTPVLTQPGATGAAVMDQFIDGGYLGVDLFFVLSGFLITALLLSEQGQHGTVRFGSFYGRRALRLLPALFFLLACYAVYTVIADQPRPAMLTTTRYALVYLSNWQASWHLSTVAEGMTHLWSLAVEEQFYLIWPWILIGFLGLRRNVSVVVTVLVAAIVAIALHRAVMWQDIPSDLSPIGRIVANGRIFYGTDTRADALLIGALLASLWVRGRTPTRRLAPAAWIATGVLVLCIEFTRGDKSFIYLGGFDLVALATAVLILAAVDGHWPGNQLLSFGPLRLVGRVSYGLYLWHYPIFFAVARHADHQPKFIRIALGYGLTVLFVTASWMLVERPALRLKRRLEWKQDVSVALPSTGTALQEEAL